MSDGQENNQGQGAGSSSAGTENTGNMIPKARFDEVNTELKAARQKISEFETQLSDAEKKRLEAQGQWEQIAKSAAQEADTLKPYKGRAETYEALIQQSNEALIQRIPEDMRDIVPLKLPPHELFGWLTANVDRLNKRPAPDIDAGAGSGGGASAVKVTDADNSAAAAAKAHGYPVSPEEIANSRKRT